MENCANNFCVAWPQKQKRRGLKDVARYDFFYKGRFIARYD
jgi:hypothetical protein